MPEVTLARLAEFLGAALEGGSPEATVCRLAALSEAGPGDLTFLANPAYKDQLAATKATAAVVPVGTPSTGQGTAFLKVDNPDLAFARAAELLYPPVPRPAVGVHPAAVVSPEAILGINVAIGAGAVIEAGAVVGDRCVLYPQTYIGGETKLGEDCILYPGVKICHRVTIGKRCLFQAGAVIGSDGFGYAWTGRGYYKIPQAGTVVIEDDVEIGANTCIDRARFGETRIGAGSKLDNLIQIAHNVRMGPCCAFAAQVGIAGSAQIGMGMQIGGQGAVVGHVKVGDGLTLVGQSGISKNTPGREAGVEKEKLILIGSPAKPMREHHEEQRNIKALSRLRKTVKELEERLKKLENG